MAVWNRRANAQFPPYLRKLILFDRIISCMLWVIIALLAAALYFSVSAHGVSIWSCAGMILLGLCLAVNI
ncbi:MAG: hypothetical protein M0025_12890 [Elusimicrobia bacterium]|nr:hypothetical protein [Elusimicrobiota bacterium]MDA8245001.1 hypothetical protein [Elusimicrobiota bacterium]